MSFDRRSQRRLHRGSTPISSSHRGEKAISTSHPTARTRPWIKASTRTTFTMRSGRCHVPRTAFGRLATLRNISFGSRAAARKEPCSRSRQRRWRPRGRIECNSIVMAPPHHRLPNVQRHSDPLDCTVTSKSPTMFAQMSTRPLLSWQPDANSARRHSITPTPKRTQRFHEGRSTSEREPRATLLTILSSA